MAAPANDDIGSAGAITLGSPVTGTLVDATADAWEQTNYGASTRTVYYSWHNETGDEQTFTVSDITADSPALDGVTIVAYLKETYPTDAEDLYTNNDGGLATVFPGADPSGGPVPDGWWAVVLVYTDDGSEGSFGFASSAALTSGASAVEGRVLIAFDDGPLEPSPTWTRIDDVDGFVADIEITAGKQSETDESETNHATVRLNDKTGVADPNNPSSPWFGKLAGRQIMLQLHNPVEDAWFTRFRGTIKKPTYDVHPATREGISIVSNVSLECVVVFDLLSRKQQIPGIHGDVPPTGDEAMVFWEDGEVNTRITSMLTWAGLDSSRYVVFTGNVLVIETKYDPGDPFLIGLRDAADAETASALANIYEDRQGRFVFHGRGSRLDPDTVAAGAGSAAWDFQRYKLGDGAAIEGDADFAQIRPPFQFSQPLDRLINAALITPRREDNATPFDRTTVPTLVVTDTASIDEFDVYPFNSNDLINGGHKTNGDTASQDLMRTAQFLVDNYKQPQIRIEASTIKALRPDDPRAERTWNILSRADISDVVSTNVGYAGGVGIGQDDFIEGWTQTITPLNPEHDMVVLTVNLSPVPTDATAYDD